MYCAKCGKEIPDNATFCSYFGTNIQATSKPEIQTSVYSSKPSSGKSHAKLIGGVVAAIVIIAIVFVIVSNLPGFSGNLFNPTNPDVTMISGNEGFEGLNYVYKVHVNVRNNGGSGRVEVFAQINGAGRYEEKSQIINLDEGESRSLQFVFDISVLGTLGNPSISYKAWANPV